MYLFKGIFADLLVFHGCQSTASAEGCGHGWPSLVLFQPPFLMGELILPDKLNNAHVHTSELNEPRKMSSLTKSWHGKDSLQVYYGEDGRDCKSSFCQRGSQLGFIVTNNERLLPPNQTDGLQGRWSPSPPERYRFISNPGSTGWKRQSKRLVLVYTDRRKSQKSAQDFQGLPTSLQRDKTSAWTCNRREKKRGKTHSQFPHLTNHAHPGKINTGAGPWGLTQSPGPPGAPTDLPALSPRSPGIEESSEVRASGFEAYFTIFYMWGPRQIPLFPLSHSLSINFLLYKLIILFS